MMGFSKAQQSFSPYATIDADESDVSNTAVTPEINANSEDQRKVLIITYMYENNQGSNLKNRTEISSLP